MDDWTFLGVVFGLILVAVIVGVYYLERDD